jgi:hypothetical protein
MTAEFERKLKEIITDRTVAQKLAKIIREAGNEFPCLSCPSKVECNNYKWFVEWFGNQKSQ